MQRNIVEVDANAIKAGCSNGLDICGNALDRPLQAGERSVLMIQSRPIDAGETNRIVILVDDLISGGAEHSGRKLCRIRCS